MQFDAADIELMQDKFDAQFDGRMVGAVACDEFLDNGPQCRGRKLQMRDAHGVRLLRNAKSITASLLI